MSRLIKVNEAADRLGLHAVTVYEMVKRGELSSVRVGSRYIRLFESEIERWIKEHRKPARVRGGDSQ